MSDIVDVLGPNMTLRVERSIIEGLGYKPKQKLTDKEFVRVIEARAAAKKAAEQTAA